MSFSVNGNNLEIEKVFVKEGDKIKKGDKIATVKTETLELNIRTAHSNYLFALADYNETTEGATEEEIMNAQDKIYSAEISLNQSKINLENTKESAKELLRKADDNIYSAQNDLRNAKNNLDDNQDELSSQDVKKSYENLVDIIKLININLDNVLKESDEILGIDNKQINNNFESLLGAKDKSYFYQAKNGYLLSKNELQKLDYLVLSLNLNSSYGEVEIAATQVILTLKEFETHLYYMNLMLENTIISSNFSQTELNNFISGINTNRTTVNTKITTLNTRIQATDDAKNKLDDYLIDYSDAERNLKNVKEDFITTEANANRNIENSKETVKSRELNLEQVKRDYKNLLLPLTKSEKAIAISKLTTASVNLEKSQNELKNATILSPIDGELARLNYKTGDIIVDNSNSDPVAVIINNDTLFIEVDIEESNINKIKIGQTVYISFDALNNLQLDGEVSFISLTSKINNNGIITYLVRVVIIAKDDNQIREGMTASADFVTKEVKNALIVPVTAVRNIKNTPSVLNNSKEWIPVTTGFTDGKNVEIIEGLKVGDKIMY